MSNLCLGQNKHGPAGTYCWIVIEHFTAFHIVFTVYDDTGQRQKLSKNDNFRHINRHASNFYGSTVFASDNI